MFLPERYRRQPWRGSSAAAVEPPADCLPEPDAVDEPTDLDEPEDVELSDADFLRELRADVEGVRAGLMPSITDAMRPALKDSPWGPWHKRRGKRGEVL
jgi:hypothetical protein